MVNRFSNATIYCFVLFFLSACAQVVAPTGGPKDIQPPSILKAHPENQSTNFNSQEVNIEFDEFLALKNLKENLLVSPPLKYDLDVKTKGKKLQFYIKDTLRENTTYVLNFGNSITDLSENNPIRNFQYVFSTGSTIDTLDLKGKVIDAFSLETQKDFLVMLYPKDAVDSAFQTQLPNYVSRTDEEGNFTIANIKEGEYQIYALKDANNNYLFDRSSEAIAFSDTNVVVDINNPFITLKTFKEEEEKQFIEKKTAKAATLLLEFKKEIIALNYRSLTDTVNPILLITKSDTAQFWWPESNDKEIELVIQEGEYIDTIEIKIDSFPASDHLHLLSSLSGVQDYFKPITLKFNRPIQELNDSNVVVKSLLGRSIPFDLKRDTSDAFKVMLNFSFQEDSSYTLQLFPNSFIDIYGKTVDSSSHQITFNTPQDLGELSIILENTDSTDKIIQLIDDQGSVLHSATTKNNTVNFINLAARSYGVKLIEDRNSNGKWDIGIYGKRKQPERAFLFEEKVEIRKNWEKEIRWIIK